MKTIRLVRSTPHVVPLEGHWAAPVLTDGQTLLPVPEPPEEGVWALTGDLVAVFPGDTLTLIDQGAPRAVVHVRRNPRS